MLNAFGMGFRGMAGPARSAAAGYAAMAGRGARALSRSPTGMGAVGGAAWGMASDDTSVIGGAMIGAGLGRYGVGPAMRTAKFFGGARPTGALLRHPATRGDVLGVFGRTVQHRGMMDFGMAKIASNRGYNKIRGLFS